MSLPQGSGKPAELNWFPDGGLNDKTWPLTHIGVVKRNTQGKSTAHKDSAIANIRLCYISSYAVWRSSPRCTIQTSLEMACVYRQVARESPTVRRVRKRTICFDCGRGPNRCDMNASQLTRQLIFFTLHLFWLNLSVFYFHKNVRPNEHKNSQTTAESFQKCIWLVFFFLVCFFCFLTRQKVDSGFTALRKF